MFVSDCPFCALVQGREFEGLITQQDEIVYQDEYTTAFVNCDWWANNPGNVVVIPNKHFENLYDITEDYLAKVNITAQKIAIAMKSCYGCDGISTRQHNELAGNQSVFHFHMHVFPRYEGDDLYVNYPNWFRSERSDRLHYAEKLRKELGS